MVAPCRQPVQEEPQTLTGSKPAEPNQNPPQPLIHVEETNSPPFDRQILSKLSVHETRRLSEEVENAKKSMGTMAFGGWLRKKAMELAHNHLLVLAANPAAAMRHKALTSQPVGPSARPPPAT